MRVSIHLRVFVCVSINMGSLTTDTSEDWHVCMFGVCVCGYVWCVWVWYVCVCMRVSLCVYTFEGSVVEYTSL